MTSKNNWAPHLGYIKLCSWFRSRRSIQTRASAQKRSKMVNIGVVPYDLEFRRMTKQKNDRASFLYFVKLCASFRSNWWLHIGYTLWKRAILVKIGIFVPCVLETWWMNLIKDRASLLCYIKLCSSFRSHCWIQTGVRFPKRSIWVTLKAIGHII